jgi:hypothetical protein
MLWGGALRIQRLEGSRPHGRLCTLNWSERVQGNQEGPELGGVRLPECLTERRVGWPRPDAETGEPVVRGVLAEVDKGSACAPKHE